LNKHNKITRNHVKVDLIDYSSKNVRKEKSVFHPNVTQMSDKNITSEGFPLFCIKNSLTKV